jgi:hypothetical protein
MDQSSQSTDEFWASVTNLAKQLQINPTEIPMKKQAETKRDYEDKIRDAGKALADLIEEHQDNNKPLADRAKALLSDVVELTARIATK